MPEMQKRIKLEVTVFVSDIKRVPGNYPDFDKLPKGAKGV